MEIHRQYDLSFKERAVKMSYERDNIKTLASDSASQPSGFISGIGNLPIMVMRVFKITVKEDESFNFQAIGGERQESV